MSRDGLALQRAIEILVHSKTPPAKVAWNGQELIESGAATGWSWKDGVLTIRRQPDPDSSAADITMAWPQP